MPGPRSTADGGPRGQHTAETQADRAEDAVACRLPARPADIAYAKTKFASGYSKSTFIASHLAQTPAGREPANLLSAAWDASMNDLNEVLRNAYGLVHGYRRVGPSMPLVYAEPALGLSRKSELGSVNDDRNLLTHEYPAVIAGDLFDAIELFSTIVKPTLSEAKAFTLTQGIDIAAVT